MLEYEIIGIVGISSSGKTTLADTLEKTFPKDFKNLQQVTTRTLRLGDLYRKVSLEKYEEMKDDLIGKTEVNGTFYGTILPSSPEDKRFIIVLNKLGLENLKRDIKEIEDKNPKIKFTLCVVKIELDENVKLEKREGRDENFMLREKAEIDSINADVNIKRNSFSSPDNFARYAYLEINIFFNKHYGCYNSDYVNDR